MALTYLWVFRKKPRRSKFCHSLTSLAATVAVFFFTTQGGTRYLTTAYSRRQLIRLSSKNPTGIDAGRCTSGAIERLRFSASLDVGKTFVGLRQWSCVSTQLGSFRPRQTNTSSWTSLNKFMTKVRSMYLRTTHKIMYSGVQRSLQERRVYGGCLGFKKRWRTWYGCDKIRWGAK